MKPDDIVFYNEPLRKLEETAQAFSQSPNVYDFCDNSAVRQLVLTSKKFTKPNIEKYLKQKDESTVDDEFQAIVAITPTATFNTLKSVNKRKNTLPSIQTLGLQNPDAFVQKAPSSMDVVFKRLENKRIERLKDSENKKDAIELNKVKAGLHNELTRWRRDINRASRLLDVATLKMDLINNHAKKVSSFSTISLYLHIYTHACIYIYIYIERERYNAW